MVLEDFAGRIVPFDLDALRTVPASPGATAATSRLWSVSSSILGT